MPVPSETKQQKQGLTLEPLIALLAAVGITVHLVARYVLHAGWHEIPLWTVVVLGGLPLVGGLIVNLLRREFSSDLLAGMSIVTAVILHEPLAAVLVILMLSGGQTLEAYAVRRASSALRVLAGRMPSLAHRKTAAGMEDVSLDSIRQGDLVLVLPHETCPVDGTVMEGHSAMDESYLTGEPFLLAKSVGSVVLSGAVNRDGALTVRVEEAVADSRYAKLMRVMREAEEKRPAMRRLGDRLGAIYTPVAVAIAVLAWLGSSDPDRFLAVLVVATPCPLLIGIPVAIIGAISLAARRGIVIKDPAILETITDCRTAIFDKTGTLTYGKPKLVEVFPGPDFEADDVLGKLASLERYSRHPLAEAAVKAAKEAGVALSDAAEVRELPGKGLQGVIDGQQVEVTSRKKLLADQSSAESLLPEQGAGLECVVLIAGRYAATFRYRDEPRAESRDFIQHLRPRHAFERVLLVSGDREREVRALAEQVGITEVHAGQSPEEKLALVRHETALARTVFMGDGINDAPALAAATVGVAFGKSNDAPAEAAGAVILDSSLQRVDELLHIGARMRRIALQTAIGGMALSIVAMFVAAAGYLPPVAGAVTQELIDVLAVLNALRASLAPRKLTDYDPH